MRQVAHGSRAVRKIPLLLSFARETLGTESKFHPIPLVFPAILSRWLADSMNNNVRFVDSMNDKDTESSYLVTTCQSPQVERSLTLKMPVSYLTPHAFCLGMFIFTAGKHGAKAMCAQMSWRCCSG